MTTNILDIRTGQLFFPLMQRIYWAVIQPSIVEKKITVEMISMYLAKNDFKIVHKERLHKLFDFDEPNSDNLIFFVLMLKLLDISLEYAIHLIYADIDKMFIFAKTNTHEKNRKTNPKSKRSKKRNIQRYL